MAASNRRRKERAEAQWASSLLRTFPGKPAIGDPFVTGFIEHVKVTGKPETYSGLYFERIPPDEKYEKIREFRINPKKRSGRERAFCPMCFVSNKYYSGTLVYLPRLGVCAAIGNECADDDVRLIADKKYESERRQRQIEDYLLANLPRVPACLETILAASQAAEETLRVYRKLRSNKFPFHRMLRAVKNKQAGSLILSEELGGSLSNDGPRGLTTSFGGAQTREAHFGSLSGLTAVKAGYDPVKELQSIRTRIAPYNGIWDEEEALNYLINASSSEVEKANVFLREATRSYEKFHSNILDFRNFFSEANIARIDAWARSDLNPDPFRVRIGDLEGRISIVFENRKCRLPIVFGKEFWSAIPKWPLD